MKYCVAYTVAQDPTQTRDLVVCWQRLLSTASRQLGQRFPG